MAAMRSILRSRVSQTVAPGACTARRAATVAGVLLWAGAASAAPFTTIAAPFTAEVHGVADSFLGGIAFAPDGDVLANLCSFSGSPLLRYDQQSTTVVNTTTIHPLVATLTSDAGCGMTNHPNGSLYTNTGSGVVRLNPDSGAIIAAGFGGAGNALGIAPDPQTGNLVYVGSDGTLLYVTADFSASGTFSTATANRFIDGIYFDPTGDYLLTATRLPFFAVTVLDRAGNIVQDVLLTSEPDGIAFHATAPKFVATNNLDGTILRLDFPADDLTQTPTITTLASGGFRGDLSQVGADGCWYITQEGTRYDDGTVTTENSVVRVCPGFAPPPGVATEACCLGGSGVSTTTVPVRLRGRTECVDATPDECTRVYQGSPQGPGTSCNEPGMCSEGSTTTTTSTSTTTLPAAECGNGELEEPEACDDGNASAGDGCDASCSVEECWICDPESGCEPLDGVPCDDGNVCTVGETCSTGVCGGGVDVVFGEACRWFIVGDSESSSDVDLKEGAGTVVTGDICLDQAKIGLNSVITGNVAVTKASGASGIKFAPSVSVSGDIVTAGAGVKGIQGATLPHLTPAVFTVAGGQVQAKDVPPGGSYDTTGASALSVDCDDAMTAVDAARSALDARAADQSNATVRIAGGATLPVTPSNVGGINVIRYDRLLGGLGSSLELSGGGNPDTVMIIRVDGKFSLRGQCAVTLTDGLSPSNVILYGRGKKVQFGSFCDVAGTIYSLGKVKLGNSTTINGQVFARKQKIKLGNLLTGTVVPNLVVLP